MSFRSPLDIWVENPTFLCAEVVFVCWGLLTLRHGMLCSLVPSLSCMHKRLGTRLVTTAAQSHTDSKTSLPTHMHTVDTSPCPSHIFSHTNLPGSISRSGYFSFIYLFFPLHTHTPILIPLSFLPHTHLHIFPTIFTISNPFLPTSTRMPTHIHMHTHTRTHTHTHTHTHAHTALRHGGRYIQLWFTAVLHGLAVESLSYILPDIDNFWHYRGTIMFFNQRLPLYVVCACKSCDLAVKWMWPNYI